jgi:PAS domain S-box-containing protein
MDSVFATGVPLEIEFEYAGPQGTSLFNWRLIPEFDERREVRTLLSISRDVTAQRRAESEMRQLAEAVGQAAESIVITSKDGAIEYVNPAFERITGYVRSEALGQNPRVLKSGVQDAAFYKELWDTIMAGRIWTGRMVNRRKDGSFYTEECTISPVYDAAGVVDRFVAVKRDVTQELALEEELRQAQRLESVGQLAAGVAHDFNNMLSPILGYAEMLAAEFSRDDVRHAQLIQIKHAAERSRDLIRQLLAFSRKQVLELSLVDMCEVVRAMQGFLKRAVRENVEIRVQLDDAPQTVRADVSQIEQVLVNLCVNAQDAMPEGGVLAIAVAPARFDSAQCAAHPGLQPGQYVMLSVTDTGMGMDAETRRHIFEPFFTTKEHGKGTGLGLATVYGIVKQHGGIILVTGEPGKGAAFQIYLRYIHGQVLAEGASEVQGKQAAGTETILLVEDNVVVRELTKEILERQRYTILDAPSGIHALEIVAHHAGPIDLLLTDVVMPDMNGRELFDRVIVQRPGLKVMYMSGYPDNVIARHGALDEGVVFIQKPFTSLKLLAKVREALAARSLSGETQP